MLAILKAVYLFAENGFEHHDIKPGNIVYKASMRDMKFIDFGLSDFAEIIDLKLRIAELS